MGLRRALALTVGVALVIPPSAPAAATGLLKGTVKTLDGSSVSGVDVQLVSLDSGKLSQVRTDGVGAFEANLEPASYKIEIQKGYTVVRGPRMVAVAAGDTAPAELVVASAQVAPEGSDPRTAAKPNRGGDIIALALFSSALAGAAVYAATRGREDRKPPTTSPSR